MRTHFILLLTLPLLAAVTGCSKKHEKREISEHRLQGAYKRLNLNNTNGTIRISASDTAHGIYIKAEKMARVRKRDLDKPLESPYVSIDSSDNELHVSTSFEKRKKIFSFSVKREHEVNYTIEMPDSVGLRLENVNGIVVVSGLRNETDISVVNGDVDIKALTGTCFIEITNGNLSGSVDTLSTMTVDVVNGNATLFLLPGYSGFVNAEVVNGRIMHEGLSFTNVDSDKKTFKGRLGSGQNELRIDIVNGRVILKGASAL